jgi:hypothetical protein
MDDKLYDFLERHPILQNIYYFGKHSKRAIDFVLSPKYKLEKEHKELGLRYRNRPLRRFDTFEARETLAWVTYPILVRFRNNPYQMGHPFDLESQEEWNAIVDEIILAFRFLITENILDLEIEEHAKMYETIQKGLDLYAKWFLNLWD